MTDTATPPPSIQVPARSSDLDWDGAAVEALRRREYARLDALGQVYLDYTGGSLYAESQVRQHQDLLRRGVFGNPHSDNPTSLAATKLADRARSVILAYLRADPDEYTVIFTPNASGALKHVAESYPFTERSQFLLTYDNHNSVNGIREFARRAGAEVTYLPLRPDLRQDPQPVLEALRRPPSGAPRLFAYPAQSNYSGVRHPLDWVTEARARGWDVVLDASAFVPTNTLDLSRWQPDFVSISWYKVFGYPTGIGSLVARRSALARMRRPWFSGGTIGVASVVEPTHTLAPHETGFEDGTIDYLGLPAIEIGVRHLESIGVDVIRRRVQYLTRRLLDGLAGLRHRDGAPMIRLYGPADDRDRGGTVPFNVLDPSGRIVGFWEIEAQAAERRISLRTGCFCNPGASETARGISASDMRRIFALGRQPTVEDLRRLLPGKALGAVRASLGVASTERDVDALLEFLADFPHRTSAPARRIPFVSRIASI